MTEIQIVPVRSVDRGILEYLAAALGEAAGARCVVRNLTVDPSDAFNASRRRYNSTQILSQMLEADARSGESCSGSRC